ncbi:MAG: hypothetical protein OXG49_07425 [Chloroflexi bacterium]|nr:hypothetical protein [Chloroflexota bacterium]
MAEATVLHNEEKVLELLQAHVQSQKDALRVLETKAMHNLTIVNIIAGIVAALNLPFSAGEVRLERIIGNQPLVFLLATALSIALVALCALVAILSIRTLWVRRHRTHPMRPTEQNAEDWTACEPEYFSELMQKSYIQIYENNARIVDDKGSMVTWSHKAIVAIICLIFSGSFLLGVDQLLAALSP